MLLAASYLSALPASVQPPPDLELKLADLFARGAAAHPALRLAEDAFARHLARCGAALDAELRAEDLFLVCGALAGDRVAVESLRRAHAGVIASSLRRAAAIVPLGNEIEQQLWDLLLVGDTNARPRLAGYSGRGELAGFIGVCAQRFAVTSFRRSAAQERALASARAEAIVVGGDPELAIIKQRYRREFEQAVREALPVLDDRERMMLRMFVIEGHSHEQIAAVYRLNQSSVSRCLAKARDRVLGEARRLLRERMNLSEAEFDSLANLVLSQLDVSMSRMLALP